MAVLPPVLEGVIQPSQQVQFEVTKALFSLASTVDPSQQAQILAPTFATLAAVIGPEGVAQQPPILPQQIKKINDTNTYFSSEVHNPEPGYVDGEVVARARDLLFGLFVCCSSSPVEADGFQPGDGAI